MKERPILFSSPMVRALLDGTKTQTRRVVKPPRGYRWLDMAVGTMVNSGGHKMHRSDLTAPYGQPGDRLWVREAWAPKAIDPECTTVAYRATDDECNGPWKPSIHMPRWASRIDIEITGVRVERLQDIGEADADAEGCERLDSERDERDWKLCPQCGGTRLYTAHSYSGAFPDTDCMKCDTYVKRYEHLWEAINGAGSWAVNPWVWVVEFRSVRP